MDNSSAAGGALLKRACARRTLIRLSAEEDQGGLVSSRSFARRGFATTRRGKWSAPDRVVAGEPLPHARFSQPRLWPPAAHRRLVNEEDPGEVADDERPQGRERAARVQEGQRSAPPQYSWTLKSEIERTRGCRRCRARAGGPSSRGTPRRSGGDDAAGRRRARTCTGRRRGTGQLWHGAQGLACCVRPETGCSGTRWGKGEEEDEGEGALDLGVLRLVVVDLFLCAHRASRAAWAPGEDAGVW